ncbi:MAG: hypothetical protein OQL09_10500 [Gammaproteobacteria bacterium]|nr:hypothetical protein [Gammaproteobacteria bacterium]
MNKSYPDRDCVDQAEDMQMQSTGGKIVTLLLVFAMLVAPIRTVSAVSPDTNSDKNKPAVQMTMPAHHNHAAMGHDPMQHQSPASTAGHNKCKHKHCSCSSSGTGCDCNCTDCMHIDIGLISLFTLPAIHHTAMPPRVAFTSTSIILAIDTHPPISLYS